MQLLILGTGEAFDDKGLGNTSSVFYGKNMPTILFDCGYQIPERLWQYPKTYKNIDAIYLTHLHGDHTMGLPALFIRFFEEGRKKKLTIFGPKGTKENVMKMCGLAYASIAKKLKYKIEIKEIKSGQSFSYKKVRFSCAHSFHSRLNLGIRASLPRGKSFAISGDGDLTEGTKKLFQGTDLLLHEVFSPTPAGVGHCDLRGFLRYIKIANIKKTGVVHISRNHIKEMKQLVSHHKGKGYKLFVPKPGQLIKL